MPPDAQSLQNHLAYEVHWLVHSAVRFRDVRGKDRVAFQDSAFLHARNLLEFTGPGRPSHGWSIGDLGGTAQLTDAAWRGWSDLINSKVTHLGEGRLKAPPWPVREDDVRCIEMSRYFLQRLGTAANGSADPRMKIAGGIAELGLTYLERPTQTTLRPLADLVG